MARVALLIHHPSILRGARNAYGCFDVPVLDLGRMFRDVWASRRNPKSMETLSNELHVRVYMETPYSGSKFGAQRNRDKGNWVGDFESPSSEKNETIEIIFSRKREKELATRLSLDLILIAESSQYDVAVIMAMDREIAPAVEYLIDKRRGGQLGLIIETASWSSSQSNADSIDRLGLVHNDYRSDVPHRVVSEGEYIEMLGNFRSRLKRPYHLKEPYQLSRHKKLRAEETEKKPSLYPDEEEWVPIVKEAIQAVKGVGGWACASAVGEWLKKNKPDFDPHNYHNRRSAYKLVGVRPDIFDIRNNPASIKIK